MGNCFPVQFIFENILNPSREFIVGRANYVWKLEETLDALSADLEELEAQRSDVGWKFGVAEQGQQRPLEQVRQWLSAADTMITEAKQLLAVRSEETDNLCLGGCVSKHCLSTYKFGEKVAKMLQAIKDHKSKGVFDKFAVPLPVAPAPVVAIRRPGERPVALDSTIDQVWSCIMGKDAGIIGLYGIGGVGKTTVLTQINNRFCTTQNGFDVVIWVTVSRDYTDGKIQDEIGGVIGFSNESWKSKSVNQKALDIHGDLFKKRFVVLLDDLWGRVDLEKVGIPKPSQENGSKLIFTTRLLEVCGEMEARKKIRVECLKPEEAWNLFQDKVGEETLNSHPDIPKLAEQVAKECGGLPLALITIGRAMACKTTLGEWEFAIEKLRQSALPKMEDEVFPLLKFSYDNLSNTVKRCLLYCCLYPEDYNIPIRRLVEYWFCEGLLNEYKEISAAKMQGDHIVNSLLSACLLERGGEEHVKMHDVIRDMGLWIACKLEAKKEDAFFVKARAQLFKVPDVKAWESSKRMSVTENKIYILEEKPNCPNLRTLFLSQNMLEMISDGFFNSIPRLTVLNLSWNGGLEALPKGISQLSSLRCLDLTGTSITELPIELKSLTKLKMLELSLTKNLRKIPPRLISSFSELQIFRMVNPSRTDYPKEDNVLDGYNNEKLMEELSSLKYLNIVRIPSREAKIGAQSLDGRMKPLDKLFCPMETQ
ncbi:hypothetical protein V6N13_032804 [Hibiscus sabdariffa]|uniref:NB-ARC domain-containing protein n=1 Tax=Hibiscus sabdariffa TaxID=183260 RepID=A0ABR2FC13_9ROSI